MKCVTYSYLIVMKSIGITLTFIKYKGKDYELRYCNHRRRPCRI